MGILIATTLSMFELDAYLSRIEYAGPRQATAEALRAIHFAHATHIPFENLDVLAGLPIRLDPESLQAKLVQAKRGGYCFEQNMLLAGALESMGYRLKRLLARVRFRAERMLPLTHMAIEVEADGQSWLCDVGFGGHGLLEPIPFERGQWRQGVWAYRLARENDRWWILQAPMTDGFIDLYTLTRDDYPLIDFEPPNFFVSTHPESIFRQKLMAQRPLPDVRYLLVGRDFTELHSDGAAHCQTIGNDAELIAILAERFNLHVPQVQLIK